ncbi:sugar transferase [Calidithermus roseus]|uniref:Putative undecaprenyl-phosphate N-acetylgalactosaminyl 1-phosphate transferase n=1 Tax=Calidithermus roseus TaxID=1644118 RepID=A0A399EQM2_9DEIN|nr:sugar transferase [Calidithermus roseus]RIH84451.1 putative undecaprenyl-phosphate N-acetylgalactosaminyl 1-phosphate transferase [Calidithermus roseus]
MKPAKRLFDLAAATLGIILLLPLFLLLALLIKLDDWGPVFFRQERVGYRGKPFRIWKFRSMVVNAPKLGGVLTVGRDPRITRVGYWLRKFKLDELPQLFNVFLGEMSFVGPRPEVAKYVALYTPDQRRVLELVPGITDLASIKYRNESEVLAKSPDPERTYIEEVMPEKIRINLEYACQASIGSDLMVILQTLVRLWR